MWYLLIKWTNSLKSFSCITFRLHGTILFNIKNAFFVLLVWILDFRDSSSRNQFSVARVVGKIEYQKFQWNTLLFHYHKATFVRISLNRQHSWSGKYKIISNVQFHLQIWAADGYFSYFLLYGHSNSHRALYVLGPLNRFLQIIVQKWFILLLFHSMAKFACLVHWCHLPFYKRSVDIIKGHT